MSEQLACFEVPLLADILQGDCGVEQLQQLWRDATIDRLNHTMIQSLRDGDHKAMMRALNRLCKHGADILGARKDRLVGIVLETRRLVVGLVTIGIAVGQYGQVIHMREWGWLGGLILTLNCLHPKPLQDVGRTLFRDRSWSHS